MIQNKIVKIGKVYQYNNIECDIILGNDFLQQFSIYQQKIYTIILKTPCDHWIRVPRILKPFKINYDKKARKWRTEKINTSITYKITVQDTCKKLKENFSNNPLKYWEKTKIYCKLEMIDPDKVIRVRPMIYSQEDIEDFKIQINELIQLHLIRESKSPHSSPAFMVRKHSEIKRGKARMVINYKEVNKNTKFDGYYIPNKEILINLARGKNYYSKFDCKSGFWQIKMDNDSIHITAFSTPRGHYEWIVMPFGLKNAPQVFQRKMDKIFSDYSSFIIVYIDDMLICSDNEKDHEKHLDIFITLCKEHGIILSEKKVEIKKKEIEFLGMIIDSKGIRLQSHIAEKIKEFPDELRTKEMIQKFLGCLNYSSDFIKDLAKERQELQKLLTKKNQTGWNDKHTMIVRRLKNICSNLPKLRLPNENDNLILQTDASDKYWAAILKTDLGEICRYTSGTFNNNQINYDINEKELLAIIKGINKFEIFLLPKPFIIETDNTQVAGFIKNNTGKGVQARRLSRWQTLLSYYNCSYKRY